MKKLTVCVIISTVILYLVYSLYNGCININQWSVNSHRWFMFLVVSDLVSFIALKAFGWDKEIDKVIENYLRDED